MGKNDFIKKLNKHLKDIPDEERQDIIRDFDEHFWMAEEEGKNEQQIANDLGDPKALAKSLKANFFINQAKTNTSWNDMRNALRSEERRVGKECRSRGSAEGEKERKYFIH